MIQIFRFYFTPRGEIPYCNLFFEKLHKKGQVIFKNNLTYKAPPLGLEPRTL